MLENKDTLKQTIETLQMALQAGYSLKSSPVGFLCEAAADLSLRIARALKEGSSDPRNNPELRFLDESDALGNPKQVRIETPPNKFWDPQLAEVCSKLAGFFIKIKKQENPLAFMAKEIPNLSPSVKSEELDESSTKISANIAKIAEIAYHRRQKRKKRSISKHS